MPTPISHHPQSNSNFSTTLISGALGGAAGGYTCFPFEGLKKRFQTGALHPRDVICLTNGKFVRALHPKELFRGSLPFSTAVMVASTTSMTFNKSIKQLSFYDPSSKGCELIAAVCSGMLGAITGSTPVENVILTQQKLGKGPVTAIKHILSQGITRPWAGLPELMAREGGFTGVMLFAGPTAKKITLEKTDSKTLSVVAELLAGAGGALLTQPADTLATYRQERDGKISLTRSIKQMYASGGAKIFFKGALPRIFLFTGCSVIIPKFAKQIEFLIDNSE